MSEDDNGRGKRVKKSPVDNSNNQESVDAEAEQRLYHGKLWDENNQKEKPHSRKKKIIA